MGASVNKIVQELIELAEDAIEYIPPYFREKYGHRYQLEILCSRLEPVGCWIPCGADNPPPAETPLVIWVQSYPDYPRGGLYPESGPLLVNSWTGLGKLGHDITHYMLIGSPEL